MPIQSYNTAWRDIVNTNTNAVTKIDEGGVRRNVNSVWVNDGASWKKVFNSSLYDTASTNKKRDMMFIGDSITWGYGLVQTQAHPYLVQQRINSVSGYTSCGWTARNITMDDTTSSPFNGGASSPLKIVASGALTGVNAGPFSGYAGTPATNPLPCISFKTPGDLSYISFNVTSHPTYIVIGARGSGTLNVYQEGYTTPIQTLTLAASNLNYIVPTSPKITGGNPDFTISLSTGTNAEIISLHPTNTYNGYATGFINCVVNGRNSYAVADYISSGAISQIQSSIVNTVSQGATVPIYILGVGTVSMYDSSRQVSPATFKTQLQTLITGLSTGTNPGKVILTMPPKPGAGWSTPTGTTAADYNAKIIELANSNGVDYVDLYNGPFISGTYLSGSGTESATISYQADNIHPSATGAQQIANRFCCSLGL